jgi:hypothetical protein
LPSDAFLASRIRVGVGRRLFKLLVAAARSRGGRDRAIGMLRAPPAQQRRSPMSIGTLLLIVLILIFLGAIPTWPYSQSWGYAPSGTIGIILLVVVVLVLTGRV